MKKLFFRSAILSLCTLAAFTSAAQKYKVKDNIVYKNKEEIAKVEGKISLTKQANLTFYNNDNVILKVKGKYFDGKYPGFGMIRYYELEFPQFDLSAGVKATTSLINEKQIIRYLLNEHGIHFYQDGLKKEEVDALMAEDASRQIQADTMRIVNSIKFYKSSLSNNSVPFYDTPAKTYIQPIPEQLKSEYLNATHWILKISAYSDEQEEEGTLIGLLDYGREETTTSAGTKIDEWLWIKKKLNEEKVYGDDTYQYLTAGYADLRSAFGEIFSYELGIDIKYDSDPNDNLTTQLTKIVKKMVDKELL